ncbi:hypothetical protein [Sporosarcina sp. FSL K6-3457]|uniref:hypothetical protein n=1 Tax=Sporosarcina sp. FSL K6-3457 TaxID=2978204 RepID=UPI0030FB2B94
MKTLREQLIEKGFSQARTSEIDQKNTRTSTKPKERLSDREWAELMGVNRGTHRRVKGRVKQR